MQKKTDCVEDALADRDEGTLYTQFEHSGMKIKGHLIKDESAGRRFRCVVRSFEERGQERRMSEDQQRTEICQVRSLV